MSLMDNILEKVGLKFEDLNPIEKETLFTWQEALQKSQLSLENVKTYIKSMRDAVEVELTKTDLDSKQDMFLKARLRNYMLLEAFLSTPERAKEALDKAIAGIAGSKK